MFDVSVKTSCAVSLPVLRHGSTNLCPKLVASVGRCFKSGDLMASIGKLVPQWSGPFDFKKLRYPGISVDIFMPMFKPWKWIILLVQVYLLFWHFKLSQYNLFRLGLEGPLLMLKGTILAWTSMTQKWATQPCFVMILLMSWIVLRMGMSRFALSI